MLSNNRNWLRIALAIVFAFSLNACSGDFNPNVETEQPTEDDDDGDTGGDGGTNTGGDLVIDPATGTWEKKDEDGDGVLDERDDFPFDANRSVYPQITESEPNDNPSVATPLNNQPPFRLFGAISDNADNGDLFSFTGKSEKSYTIVLKTSSQLFVPQVYFSDANGTVLNFGKIILNESLGLTAANIFITTDGLYHVGIVDSNFKGSVDFSYTVEVFEDLDVDAIDDIKEAALAINSELQDTDSDEILDAEEFYFTDSSGNKIMDADGDSIPNWLDEDSDNDNILDKIEGASDPDGDGIGSFLDLDSDDNNILDSVEVGNDVNAPDDYDLDNIADFKDKDDDGDGLWDVNDNLRLQAIDEADGEKLFLNVLEALHVGELTVKNFIRVGDELLLNYENNLSSSSSLFVVFQKGTESENVSFSSTDSTFHTQIPSGTQQVYISNGTVRSNKRNVQLQPENAPVLIQMNSNDLIAGETITLSGVDFTDDITVLFSSGAELPTIISPTSLQVKVPENVQAGAIQVNNQVGASNKLTYFVSRTVEVTFVPASELTQDDVQIEAINGDVAQRIGNTEQYSLKVKQGSPIALFSWILDENGEKTGKQHISAYAIPTIDTVELSVASTAVKLILDFISLSNLDVSKLAEIKDAIMSYDEYQDVFSHLNLLFESSATAIDPLSTDTVILLSEKALLIRQKLDNDGLTKAAIYRKKALLRKEIQNNKKLGKQSFKQAEGILKPDISTFESAHFDMSMEATNFLDSWLPSDPKCPENSSVTDDEKSKMLYDGCVELQNRTRLFLSSRIFAMGKDGDYREADLDTPLRGHIASAYDGNMIGPQDGTFLGIEMWSKDHLYPECPYQSCIYQILAPGIGQELGPTPFNLHGTTPYDVQARDARQYLAIRTIVEGILLKYFDLVLVLIDYEPSGFDPVAVTKIMIKYSPNLVSEITKLYNDDDVTQEDLDAAAYSIVNEFYKNEVEVLFDLGNGFKFGPIMTEIFASMGLETDDLLSITAEALANQFAPLKGQIEAIVKGAKIADIIIDQVKTVKDMAAVPIKTDFLVNWGLKIVDLDPIMVQAVNQNKELRIIGSGFGINEKWYWFDEEPITILDDLGRSETLERIVHDSVSEDGTVLTITIPGEYLEASIGRDITVTVEHREQTAVSPVNLQIGDGLEIARLKANQGQPGDIVEIDGLGFSTIPSRNKVTFTGKNGARIVANVSIATNNKLTVTVPNGIVTGDVTVEVSGEVSNGLVFTVPFVVEITYGDNGNLNDDIFKLVVDGSVISDSNSPQRQIGPISLPMSSGTHNIKLLGIKADDGIGTYYIEFTGDVLSVSGDAQEGRDLLKDTAKSFDIEVGESNVKTLSTKTKYLINLQAE